MNTSPKVEITIDQCEVLYRPSGTNYAQILERIYEEIASSKAQGGKLWKNEYVTKAELPLPNQNAMLKAGISGKAGPYIKLDFYPAQHLDAGMKRLAERLNNIFDDGYATLFQRAFIKRLDVAIDVTPMPFGKVCVVAEKLRSVDKKHYEEGTLYIGGKKSPRHVCIYNKTKQLLEEKHVHAASDITRIEVRLRPKRMPLSKVLMLTNNPLLSMHVFTRETADSVHGDANWKSFKHAVFEEGVIAQVAYLSFPPKVRRGFTFSLFKARCNWWKAKQMWEQALKEFSILTPTGK